MRLTAFHLDDLHRVQNRQVLLTSAGFELDGDGVPLAEMNPFRNERLDALWVDDYIDADIRTPDEPAVVELTDKGRQALAKAEQESSR